MVSQLRIAPSRLSLIDNQDNLLLIRSAAFVSVLALHVRTEQEPTILADLKPWSFRMPASHFRQPQLSIPKADPF